MSGTSFDSDVENGLPSPKSSSSKRNTSEKLRQLDKKTLAFAGYIFWAIVFVAGGATTAALLTQKKGDPPTEAPSTFVPVPTGTPSVAPTNFPTETPSNFPSQSPTVSPLSSLHDFVMEKIETVFEEWKDSGCDKPTLALSSGDFFCDSKKNQRSLAVVQYNWEEGRYTFQEGVGVGVGTSESVPSVRRPVSVTATVDAVRLEQVSAMFETGLSSLFGGRPSNPKDTVALISLQNSHIDKMNANFDGIFPRTHTIKLNKDCGIECFKDSLDALLKGLNVGLDQLDQALAMLDVTWKDQPSENELDEMLKKVDEALKELESFL